MGAEVMQQRGTGIGIGVAGLLLAVLGCSYGEPVLVVARPRSPAPSASVAVSSAPAHVQAALEESTALETALRDSGPLHLAATGVAPNLACIAKVEGGPVLVSGTSLFAWDTARASFVERPDLGSGRDAGCSMIGRIDGDLWTAREGVKTAIVRRTAGTAWQEVATLDGHVELELYGSASVLAKESPRTGSGSTRFLVFGDPPLPKTPTFPATTAPCSVDFEHGGIAALGDGTVIAGSACYALWSPASGKTKVTLGFNRATVVIKGESSTSAIVYGEDERLQAIVAHGDGVRWTRVDTSQLGRLGIWGAGRTSDGSEWVLGEPSGEPRSLYRSAPGSKEWQRIPIAMGTQDPKEERRTHVSTLEIIDGELWIRAEYAESVTGPYRYAIYTTRPIKRVLTTR